ncbi:MAG: type II/IV secretion system protein [Deltaproteobacteria bacterium]|nr:type II/IV secretion system protein [Deltaproteobacteria bacterium]
MPHVGGIALQTLQEALVGVGLLTSDQWAVALESQKNLGLPLEQILIQKGFLQEEALLKALARKLKTTFVSLVKYRLDPEIVKLLPVSLARKYRAIPLFKIENRITVATSNPMNLMALDDIQDALKADIDPIYALDRDIELAIREHYRVADLMEEATSGEIEILGSVEAAVVEETPIERLEREASNQKIVSTVNNLLSRAYADSASDIHLEPTREKVRVRLRIDGVLEELPSLSKTMHLSLISRIKIMGGMDIAERRLPQDGRVRVRVSEKEVDLRIATYPTLFGEAAAIRLLSKEQLRTLEELGFLETDLKIFKSLIVKPHGIFLVTGPTGSGKTTTLYASLMQINSGDRHILSIEDPIENEIPGVSQQQVHLKAGLTFASSLRAMLREDPDVILVGEIRDAETAEIAVRAAMTGHLVFSSLHTNTAIGAIARLIDLGVEPFLISSSLIGVVAQRLIRKICPQCKSECEVGPSQLQQLGLEVGGIQAYRGIGCKECRQTGYRGRMGLFEIVQVNDEVRVLINNRLPEVRIREKVAALGHHPILADGIEKIKQGATTLDEVLRVTAET